MEKLPKFKKRKLMKKSDKKLQTTLKSKNFDNPQSTNQTPKKPPNPSISADSDSDSDDLSTLLEPFSKDQLIEFLCDAVVNNSSLYDHICNFAEQDVSQRKVFIHGLGWDTTRDDVVSAFESFGEIEECSVIMDRNTGKAKGFGFVIFKTRKGATMALKNPRTKVNNRIASCQLASVGSVAPPQGQDAADRKIYVGDVPSDVDAERLRAIFAKFGEIETGPIGFDMMTGKSRGYALFLYKTLEGAKKALEEPFKIFEGHQLHCRKAADGKAKNQVQPVMGQGQAQAPVLSAVAAAQNLALFSQHPSLNPMYSALLANPGAGWITAGGSVNPMMAGALNQGALGQGLIPGVVGGAYGVGGAAGLGGHGSGTYGLGSLGGVNPSVLGTYGSSVPQLQGLPYAYPNMQIAQSAPSRTQGTKGSFSGYSSYK